MNNITENGNGRLETVRRKDEGFRLLSPFSGFHLLEESCLKTT